MTPKIRPVALALIMLVCPWASAGAHDAPKMPQAGERWLAGDHHVHSRFSVDWNEETTPPTPIMGGDAIYPIPMNAVMGRRHGLDWMVSTDHGGPGHARIHLEHAYPELLESRAAVPDLVQFYGMEFDTPGADHSSIIMPHSHDEAAQLHQIESRYNKREPWPEDKSWDTEPRMIEALQFIETLPLPPVLIAHHPSRSATGLGQYGQTGPAELRAWNDTAPGIAVAMEGAPGHQAAAQMRPRFGPSNHAKHFGDRRPRGAYSKYPTMGGFDQMSARVGGFWDSMLGENRRWWITATSDSHIHWTDGGIDFWPGEYSKTYVLAQKNHDAILASLRAGRVFVTTGDLVSELWVTLRAQRQEASIGGALSLNKPADVQVEIRFLDPETNNAHGENPQVNRVDLIVGEISGRVDNAATDAHASTRVEARFDKSQWQRDGKHWRVRHSLKDVRRPIYVRVRGTSTQELEPTPDMDGEDPWKDLWFYSNPSFVEFKS